jgi:acetyl esterase/lipase
MVRGMNLRSFASASAALFLLAAQLWADSPAVIRLWANGAPGSEARKNELEQAKDYWVKNIHDPSLTVFLPPAGKANGTAVIICPGGGHRELVFNAEGAEPGAYLASLGVTAFALKYRLFREPGSTYKLEDAAADLRRALRLVRSRAKDWGLDPDRIGVMGWSAGAELAATVAYQPAAGNPQASDPVEQASARPDFQIIIYPGELGTPAVLPADAPPAFFLCANDDVMPSRTAVQMLEKYRAAGVPVELHLYTAGGHAFNMGQRSKLVSIRGWSQRLADWLQDRGLLTPAETKK